MSFFGLTALGPQNVFAKVERNATTLQIFEEQDFSNSWDKIVGKGINITKSEKIPLILKALFHGDVPIHDQSILEGAFDEYISTITKSDFIQIMNDRRVQTEQLEEQLKGKPKSTCEFTSSTAYQAHLLNHKPLKYTLHEKQTQPLTAMQEYGWTQSDLELPKHGRGGSDVTKFQSELIKAGVYY